jgi:hypothetical protein
MNKWQAVEAHRVVRRRGSHIFYTISTQMAVKLSALRACRPLPPPPTPGIFLVLSHFSQTPSRPKGRSAAERISTIEKSNDLIGNRTRDLPACIKVPQPATLPRAPHKWYNWYKLKRFLCDVINYCSNTQTILSNTVLIHTWVQNMMVKIQLCGCWFYSLLDILTMYVTARNYLPYSKITVSFILILIAL